MPGGSSGSDVVFFEQTASAEVKLDLVEQFPLHSIEPASTDVPRFVQRGTIPSLVVTSPEHVQEAEDISVLIARRAAVAGENVITIRQAHLGVRHAA